MGTNFPDEKLDVRGAVKAEAFKVGTKTGVTLNCPNGMTIRQVAAGIVVDAVCN